MSRRVWPHLDLQVVLNGLALSMLLAGAACQVDLTGKNRCRSDDDCLAGLACVRTDGEGTCLPLCCGGDLLTFTFNSGDSTDSSGQGHHGRPSVNPSGVLPSPVAGRYGLGMHFGGNCALVLVTDRSTLFARSHATVEAWLFNEQRWDKSVVFGDYVGGEEPQAELSLELDLEGQVVLATNTGRSGPAGLLVTSSRTVVPLHRWVHLAATWDGQVARFYLDGGLTESLPMVSTPIEKKGGDHFVGSRPGSSSFFGIIDELRLTSHAKSAAEIQASMLHDSSAH